MVCILVLAVSIGNKNNVNGYVRLEQIAVFVESCFFAMWIVILWLVSLTDFCAKKYAIAISVPPSQKPNQNTRIAMPSDASRSNENFVGRRFALACEVSSSARM
jgi:hypothetical protein